MIGVFILARQLKMLVYLFSRQCEYCCVSIELVLFDSMNIIPGLIHLFSLHVTEIALFLIKTKFYKLNLVLFFQPKSSPLY